MLSLRPLYLAASLTVLAASTAPAATAPFSEDFDDDATGTTLPSDFVESGPAVPGGAAANYSVETDTAGNDLQAIISAVTATSGTSGVGANRSAAVNFPTLAGNDFEISTEFTIDSFSAGAADNDNTINLGLSVLGTSADFSSGSNYRFLYTLDNPTGSTIGQLSLSKIGGSSLTGTLLSAATKAPTLGVAYVLTLTGTYSGGTLSLNGTLTGGPDGTTLTVSGTDATPAAGPNFGYRTAVNALRNGTTPGGVASTAAVNVDYDNFSVVPEPGSALLALGGGVALLLRRRRRA